MWFCLWFRLAFIVLYSNILVESLVNLPKKRKKVLRVPLVTELVITGTGSIYSFSLNFVEIGTSQLLSIIVYLVIG